MINSIKKWANEILSEIKKIRVALEKIASCVKSDHHQHGDKSSISTKHWND